MKKLSVILALLAASVFTTKAQETFDPYLYLQLQGGASFDHGDVKFTELISPAAQIALGYQFSDAWSTRFAITGWQAKNTSPATATIYGLKFVQPMVDLVLDLGTAVSGWNPHRVFNPYLYLGAGTTVGLDNQEAIALASTEKLPYVWDATRLFWAMRTGLGTDIRLSDRVSLNLEFNGQVNPETFDSKRHKEFDSSFDWRLNAFAGLKFHFGRRSPRVAPVTYVPVNRPAETYEPRKPKQVVPEKYEPVEEPAFEGPAIFQGADVDVFFDLNKSVIRTDQLSTMNRLVSYLRNNPDAKVKLDGYADRATGTPEINQELSEQRVAAVRQYLVSRGIAADRVSVEAHGDTVQPFSGEKNRVVTCKVR